MRLWRRSLGKGAFAYTAILTCRRTFRKKGIQKHSMQADQGKLGRFIRNHTGAVDVLGLILSFFFVHLCYILLINPSASETLLQASLAGEPPERTLAVLFKDPEQEICLVLGFWCLWLWMFRYQFFMDEKYFLQDDFLELESKRHFSADVLDQLRASLSDLIRTYPHHQMLGHIEATLNNIQPDGPDTQFKEASDIGTEGCDLYLEQLDSRLSLTKYILWAIPSVGFIGTVRGIGEALGKAGEAMAGDISGVASSLAVAFNSTFVALVVSLVLMFVSYLLQGREERLVADYKRLISVGIVGTLSRLARASGNPEPAADGAAVTGE